MLVDSGSCLAIRFREQLLRSVGYGERDFRVQCGYPAVDEFHHQYFLSYKEAFPLKLIPNASDELDKFRYAGSLCRAVQHSRKVHSVVDSKRMARTVKSTVDEAGERPSGEASSDDIRKHATMIK